MRVYLIIDETLNIKRSKVAILKSFTDISILDINLDNREIGKVTLENEPGIISLGPNHLATGMNNVV